MKKKYLLLVVSTASVLLSCVNMPTNSGHSSGNAKTYYVSLSGNDYNDGMSPATPWKTIAKVNSEKFSGGQSILFEGGETFRGNLTIHDSGTSEALITVGSYGTGMATINAGAGNGVYTYDAGYVEVRDLIVVGGWDETSQSGNSGAGILYDTDLNNNAHLGAVYVHHCNVSGFRNGGIVIDSSPSDRTQSGYDMVKISDNTVHDNGALGITTAGNEAPSGDETYCFTSVWIGNNTVYNNYGVKAHTSGHTGDGIVVGQAGGGFVQHNIAYNNGWYSVSNAGGPAAIWCWDSKDLTFQNNIAHGNGSGNNLDGDGFDLDGGAVHCTMQYNYSYDNKGAGYLTWEFGNTRVSNGNNTVRYNVSQNNGTTGDYGEIHTGPNCNNNRYYNNTLYTNELPVKVLGGAGNQFINNIFDSSAGNPVVQCAGTSATFLDNDYFEAGGSPIIEYDGTTYTSLVGFRRTGNETYHGVAYGSTANPDLVGGGSDNYHLSVGSPMINAGFDLTRWGWKVGSTDFYGTRIPQGGSYDIGASEYVAP